LIKHSSRGALIEHSSLTNYSFAARVATSTILYTILLP
jgi:hypothetical protein